MQWIAQNPTVFYLIAGLALFGIDILVIGLSPVMFVAAGALLTSGILYVFGWNPGVLEALALCAVLSVVLAIVGHKPLKVFQNSGVREDNSSDLVGVELVTTGEVTKAGGWVNFSGSHWQARLASDVSTEKVDKGVRVKIVQVKNLELVLVPV